MLSTLTGIFYGSAENQEKQVKQVDQKAYLVNLKKRLNEDIGKSIDVEDLVMKLESTHSCIAGSYILQVIHDIKFEGSDIDIFTTDNGKGLEMYNFLQNSLHNGKVMEKQYNEISTYRPKDMKADELKKMKMMQGNRARDRVVRVGKKEKGYGYGFVICKVYEFKARGMKIQLIMMDAKHDEHSEKICHFDLEFCKVYFDGDKFYLNDSALKKEGVFCKGRVPTMKSFDRIIKYEKRGFTVKNKVEAYEKLLTAYSYAFKHNGKIAGVSGNLVGAKV